MSLTDGSHHIPHENYSGNHSVASSSNALDDGASPSVIPRLPGCLVSLGRVEIPVPGQIDGGPFPSETAILDHTVPSYLCESYPQTQTSPRSEPVQNSKQSFSQFLAICSTQNSQGEAPENVTENVLQGQLVLQADFAQVSLENTSESTVSGGAHAQGTQMGWGINMT